MTIKEIMNEIDGIIIFKKGKQRVEVLTDDN